MIDFTYKANSATMPFPRQEEILSSHVCLYRSSAMAVFVGTVFLYEK